MRLYCSCAANWRAAYGLTRAMVAELPRQRNNNPRELTVPDRKRTRLRKLYGVFDTITVCTIIDVKSCM